MGFGGWGVEERAARVVATALDVISWCAIEPAGTPPSFRINANPRRRVLRSAFRERSEPVVFVDAYLSVDDSAAQPVDICEAERMLVWW